MTHSATESLPMYCRLRGPGNSFPLLNVLDLLPAAISGSTTPDKYCCAFFAGGRQGRELTRLLLTLIPTATCSLTQQLLLPSLPDTSSTPEP